MLEQSIATDVKPKVTPDNEYGIIVSQAIQQNSDNNCTTSFK